MSQYINCIVTEAARGRAWAVLRYGHCAYDTARGSPATRHLGPTTRPARAYDTALEACDTAGWGSHNMAMRTRLGAPVCAGWARLGTLCT